MCLTGECSAKRRQRKIMDSMYTLRGNTRVHFLLNRRWVQSDPVIFTSGATGAGIDLALHIVDLYFGREVAERSAGSMNYPGKDWKGDGTDSVKSPLPSDQFSTGAPGNWQGEVITKEGPLQLAIHIWPYQNG